MILQISKHAHMKMVIEGISEEQIRIAIKRGAISRQTDGYLAAFTYIYVAYRRRGKVYRIKTVFTKK